MVFRLGRSLELELAVPNSAPSFDSTVNALSSFDADQIQQLLHYSQMQLDTKVGHKKFCLKKEKMFSKATCPKENVFWRMRGKDLHSTVPFLRCLPAPTALLFRSLRLKSVSTCPTLAPLASLVHMRRL